MPIYEYECTACGKEFEELVFGEDKEIPCPKCAAKDTRRKMSAACVRGGGDGPAGFGAMPPMGGGCGGGGFS